MFWRKRKTVPTPPPTSGRGCPCCHAVVSNWLPIRYGPVTEAVRAQAARGEVLLGGVNHGRNEPVWLCLACNTRFGSARADRDRYGRPLPPPEPPVQQRLPLRLRPRPHTAPCGLQPAA